MNLGEAIHIIDHKEFMHGVHNRVDGLQHKVRGGHGPIFFSQRRMVIAHEACERDGEFSVR